MWLKWQDADGKMLCKRLRRILGTRVSDEQLKGLGVSLVRKIMISVDSNWHRLDERERDVLGWVWGIYGFARSLDEVGKMVHLTRERVRQIEIMAAKKLREECFGLVSRARRKLGLPSLSHGKVRFPS